MAAATKTAPTIHRVRMDITAFHGPPYAHTYMRTTPQYV